MPMKPSSPSSFTRSCGKDGVLIPLDGPGRDAVLRKLPGGFLDEEMGFAE